MAPLVPDMPPVLGLGLMTEPKKNPKVDALLREAGTWRAEFEALRAIVLDCGLTEEMKWGQPCYTLENAQHRADPRV